MIKLHVLLEWLANTLKSKTIRIVTFVTNWNICTVKMKQPNLFEIQFLIMSNNIFSLLSVNEKPLSFIKLNEKTNACVTIVSLQALLRPGRFDRHILIDLPTAKEREELFEMYLAKIVTNFSISEYAPRLAHLTPGMSGRENQFITYRKSHLYRKVWDWEDLDLVF